MKKDFNPFLVTGYKKSRYFCDREDETRQLKDHLKNGVARPGAQVECL